MANAALEKIGRFFHGLLHGNPHFHGSAQVNFFDGKPVDAHVHKVVKLSEKTLDKSPNCGNDATGQVENDGKQGDSAMK